MQLDSFYALEKAIKRLQEATEHKEQNDFIRDAAIQRFEFTIELFWKCLKKILSYEKIESETPKDVLSKSYQYQLIDSEHMWIKMLDDMNNTSYAYDEENAKIIFDHIKEYVPIFIETYHKIKEKYKIF